MSKAVMLEPSGGGMPQGLHKYEFIPETTTNNIALPVGNIKPLYFGITCSDIITERYIIIYTGGASVIAPTSYGYTGRYNSIDDFYPFPTPNGVRYENGELKFENLSFSFKAGAKYTLIYCDEYI